MSKKPCDAGFKNMNLFFELEQEADTNLTLFFKLYILVSMLGKKLFCMMTRTLLIVNIIMAAHCITWKFLVLLHSKLQLSKMVLMQLQKLESQKMQDLIK